MGRLSSTAKMGLACTSCVAFFALFMWWRRARADEPLTPLGQPEPQTPEEARALERALEEAHGEGDDPGSLPVPPPPPPAPGRARGSRPDGRISDYRDPPASDLVKVQGLRVQKDAAQAYQAMLAAARADGIAAPLLELVSAYRSKERQKTLYDQGLVKYRALLQKRLGREPTDAEVEAETRKWIAAPGSSPHESGRALDLWLGLPNASENVAKLRQTPVYKWLQANMRRFGFVPYDREPWHVEYNPA